jgi:type IV pilus assembly protein PilA
MRNMQRGFSLIELMIVVSIIGILASIAMPAYQDYNVRAQVSEGFVMLHSVKQAIAETYTVTGVMPANRTEANLPSAANSTQSKYVAAVDVGTGGSIIIQFGNSANAQISGTTIQLTPYVQPDRSVVWRCGNSDAPGGTTTASYSAGSMTANYMPQVCRAGS